MQTFSILISKLKLIERQTVLYIGQLADYAQLSPLIAPLIAIKFKNTE